MQAKALMSFSGYGITASAGDVLTFTDEKVFLDLAQAGFVEQVERTEQPKTAKKAKSE